MEKNEKQTQSFPSWSEYHSRNNSCRFNQLYFLYFQYKTSMARRGSLWVCGLGICSRRDLWLHRWLQHMCLQWRSNRLHGDGLWESISWRFKL